MPEFTLQSTGTVHDVRAPSIEALKRVDVDFCDLDAFTQGYVEALFFTSECPQVDTEESMSAEHQADMFEGRTSGSIPGDVGFSDLAPDSLARIIADCAAFQSDNAELLELAYSRDYSAEQAGRDFWFTRNGHGVGFWNRDALDAPWDEKAKVKISLGARLSAACGWRTKFGEVNVWFGDHVEHGDAPLVHVQ